MRRLPGVRLLPAPRAAFSQRPPILRPAPQLSRSSVPRALLWRWPERTETCVRGFAETARPSAEVVPAAPTAPAAASESITGSEVEPTNRTRLWPWQSAPPDRWIIELTEPANLLVDPESSAEVVAELPRGELLETFGDIDETREWLLVRSPLEDNPDIMSDKPLQYRDGWLLNAEFQRAAYQLGEKVTARTEADTHPVLQVLRMIPPWRESQPGKKDGAPIPSWIKASLNELYTGKIGGVVMNGRFLVQRPSGAMPERIAAKAQFLMTPRDRQRRTLLAGLIGLAAACFIGGTVHTVGWLQGERFDAGKMAWPQLVGWLFIVAVFVTPFTVIPCYLCTNSQASTAVVVAWVNLLLYNDLFGE